MNSPGTVPSGRSSTDGASKPQVLAVDDQADSLRLLQLRLTAGGMHCHAFQDGHAALEFLQEHVVDVVILDVMMPKIDGYEVCRKIKEDPRIRDIPVIFLTAKMDAADKVQGLEVGGHDYLSKPIQQAELLARTRAALRVKQLQDQLKEQLALEQQLHQLHNTMLSEHWQKTLGQLAASLAHEINNPLAAALGTVQLLRLRTASEPRLQQSLEIVDKSLQRAGQKLRSLLWIAQDSRQLQRVDLQHLLEDLVTLTNYEAVMTKVSLEMRLEPSGSWQGVPGDLARAILYLLNNAIEAVAGRAEPRVLVTLRAVDQQHCITISDNGIGVPDEIRGRIFEPFFTTKPAPHHGVGLHLAAQVFEASRGSLDLASPCNGWATEVTVRLPIAATEKAPVG